QRAADIPARTDFKQGDTRQAKSEISGATGRTAFVTVQSEIAAIDENERLSDAMKKSVLIRSLPLEYQSTIFVLKAAGLLKITFDDIVQRLKETEVGLKGQELP
ncbi:MAG: hypothetical protein FE78DRAFT_31177, partial [Acidomyces sp. 'richmondensis']